MKYVGLFLLTLFLSIQSQAFELQSRKEILAFETTRMMCQRADLLSYATRGKFWLNAFQNSGVIAAVKGVKNRENIFEISPGLLELSTSIGFHQALTECYGANQDQKDIFFFSLLAADISGKLTAWALDLSLIRVVYYVGKTIAIASRAEVKAYWMWTIIVLEAMGKNQNILAKLSDSALMTTFFTSYLSAPYVEAKIGREVFISEAELQDPGIAEIVKDIERNKQIMNSSNSLEEKKLMAFFIKQDQENLEKIRAQLRSQHR